MVYLKMVHRNNGCRFEFVGVGGGPVLLQQYFQYAFICCPYMLPPCYTVVSTFTSSIRGNKQNGCCRIDNYLECPTSTTGFSLTRLEASLTRLNRSGRTGSQSGASPGRVPICPVRNCGMRIQGHRVQFQVTLTLRWSISPLSDRQWPLILVIRFMSDLLRKYRGSVVIMVGRGGAEPHYVHNWPPIFSW